MGFQSNLINFVSEPKVTINRVKNMIKHIQNGDIFESSQVVSCFVVSEIIISLVISSDELPKQLNKYLISN